MVLAIAFLLPPVSAAADDFAERCAAPGVVKCVGFDAPQELAGPVDYVTTPAPSGVLADGPVPPMIDTSTAASGAGSLMFTIPSSSGSSFGAYWTNFSDDFSLQFGVGDDFYVQWRQRFSKEMLDTVYYEDYANGVKQGGWKQVIVGEGDRPGTNIYSCTDLEIVVNDGSQAGFPQLYHSCGAKDGHYEGLQEPFGDFDYLLQNAIRDPACSYHNPAVPPCEGYVADRWMTFQIHIHVGTPYTNNGVYRHDSTLQLWVADEGAPSRLVIDYSPHDPSCQSIQTSQPACQTGYDLFNNDSNVRKYGQVWLLPYMTRKDPSQPHPTAYTWYDDLIVSRQPIADPNLGAPPDGVPDGSDPPPSGDGARGGCNAGSDVGVGAILLLVGLTCRRRGRCRAARVRTKAGSCAA